MSLAVIESEPQVPTIGRSSGLDIPPAVRYALDKGAGIDVIERLSAMFERQANDGALNDLRRAMVAAQAEMEPIKKDASNPQTRSRYATFDALDRDIRPIRARHHYALSFYEGDCPLPDHVRVYCDVIGHGAVITRHYDSPIVTKGIKGTEMMTLTHAKASAVTYGRRYLVALIENIAFTDKDDDGNAAGGRPNAEPVEDGYITADQVQKIRAYLNEGDVKVPEAGFLKVAKVERLEDLQASRFDTAMEKIRLTKLSRAQFAAGVS